MSDGNDGGDVSDTPQGRTGDDELDEGPDGTPQGRTDEADEDLDTDG